MTGSDDGTAVDRASAWLRTHLAAQGGTAPVREVMAAALVAGHRGRTVRRAARDLDVQTTRAVFGGPAVWTLAGQHPGQPVPSTADDVADAPAEECPLAVTATAATLLVPTSTDVYGRPGDYVQVTGPQCASQYDQRNWHRIDES